MFNDHKHPHFQHYWSHSPLTDATKQDLSFLHIYSAGFSSLSGEAVAKIDHFAETHLKVFLRDQEEADIVVSSHERIMDLWTPK